MMQLLNGECLELMKDIQSKSVDLILCDLPYGTTKNKWDSILDLNKLWEQYERVIKDHGAIVLTSQQPFTTTLAASNMELFRYEWIWQKNVSSGFLNAKKMPLKLHENVLVFYKHLPTYNPQFVAGKPYSQHNGKGKSTNYGQQRSYETVNTGFRYPTDIQKFSTNKGLHPTQKPVELMEYMVKTYTNPGDVVLDNCIGSGTTGVACKNTDREFIGIEMDRDYFEIAKNRIEAA